MWWWCCLVSHLLGDAVWPPPPLGVSFSLFSFCTVLPSFSSFTLLPFVLGGPSFGRSSFHPFLLWCGAAFNSSSCCLLRVVTFPLLLRFGWSGFTFSFFWSCWLPLLWVGLIPRSNEKSTSSKGAWKQAPPPNRRWKKTATPKGAGRRQHHPKEESSPAPPTRGEGKTSSTQRRGRKAAQPQ